MMATKRWRDCGVHLWRVHQERKRPAWLPRVRIWRESKRGRGNMKFTGLPSFLLMLSALLAAAPVAAIGIVPRKPTDRLIGEASYPTLSDGKILNLRLALNWQPGSNTVTGRLSCQPRRGLGMYTGNCPLSRGPLIGTLTSQLGQAGVTPSFYRVAFRVSGNGGVCDFSAFFPYLQLRDPRIYTLDGAYQCSDGAGTTTQTGRFSALLQHR